MKQYILLLFIMIPLLSYGKTDMEKLLERVDHAIEMDSYYQQQKEKELKRLRRQAGDAITDEERLCYLDSLYRAYSNYRYDSSCAYVSKGLQLAEATHNTFYITCFKIHRASVLSVGGFYGKAEDILETLDPKQMPYEQKLYYYFTYAWLFNYWQSYAAKSEFANDFKAKKKYYMNILLENFNEKGKKSAFYQYMKGEYIFLSSPTHRSVLDCYLKALKMTAKNDRLHPMAAYGIARYYRDLEQYDLYVKYLVEASESDGICQLKETTALQKLSYFLYETDKDNSKRATRYIQHSMEDAQFFQQPSPYDRDFKHPASDCYKQPGGCRTLPYPYGDWTHLCLRHLNHHPDSYSGEYQTEKQFEEKPKGDCGTEQAVGRAQPATDGYQQATRNLYEPLHGYQRPVYPQVG